MATAPALLGAEGDRRYLVVFASPAESRLLGGFVGGYGVLRAVDGKVTLESSGRTSDLVTTGETVDLGWSEELTNRYSRWSPGRFLQNATVTPDFPTDAALAAAVGPSFGLPPVDGVIYVDPRGLAGLLELTGPVAGGRVAPTPIGADDVADLLLRRQYLEIDANDERSDLLTSVAEATFDALTSRDLPGSGRAGRRPGPGRRRAGTSCSRPSTPSSRASWPTSAPARRSRRRRPPTWSPCACPTTGRTKLDAYIERDLTYDVTVHDDGTTTAGLDVVLRNTAPAGLPDYVAGNVAARKGRPGAPAPATTSCTSPSTRPTPWSAPPSTAEPTGLEVQPEAGLVAYSLPVVVSRGGEVPPAPRPGRDRARRPLPAGVVLAGARQTPMRSPCAFVPVPPVAPSSPARTAQDGRESWHGAPSPAPRCSRASGGNGGSTP